MEKDRLRFIDLPKDLSEISFSDAVSAGFLLVPKQLPCCFFYDRVGSILFERICELPEYYLTRTEQAILEAHASDIIRSAGYPTTVIEFGSGSSRKTRLLIEAALNQLSDLLYVPIDISTAFLREACHALLTAYHPLNITAISGEYRDAMKVLPEPISPRLFLLMGSNIGNFEPKEAIEFLSLIRTCMQSNDRLLIGVDLLKNHDLIHAAYNDPAGITARFNLNILTRINSELGGQFDLELFRHDAPFLPEEGCIEMRLISKQHRRIAVRKLDTVFEFLEGEYIRTERSYKYAPDRFRALCEHAGFETVRCWQDENGGFTVNLLAPTS